MIQKFEMAEFDKKKLKFKIEVKELLRINQEYEK